MAGKNQRTWDVTHEAILAGAQVPVGTRVVDGVGDTVAERSGLGINLEESLP